MIRRHQWLCLEVPFSDSDGFLRGRLSVAQERRAKSERIKLSSQMNYLVTTYQCWMLAIRPLHSGKHTVLQPVPKARHSHTPKAGPRKLVAAALDIHL